MNLFRLPGFRVSASCGEGIDFGGPRVGVSIENPIRCKQGYSARLKPACLSATDLVKVSMPAGRMFLADKMPPQLLAKVWGNCGFFSSGSASPAMGPVTFPGWLQCESIVIGSSQKKYRCGTQRTGVHPVSRYFHCSQLLNYCMEKVDIHPTAGFPRISQGGRYHVSSQRLYPHLAFRG